MRSANGLSVLYLRNDKHKMYLATWISALQNSKLKVIRKCESGFEMIAKVARWHQFVWLLYLLNDWALLLILTQSLICYSELEKASFTFLKLSLLF